ncbi:MAG TPA: bifunctional folylpolyglutamate synthase/dihydrofolate synthase [candidate division WOR-3 bacterium]|uniref:tetrahydrofolate synthase n=1 Tax=candidate division WOR-3 bacterium TaxID=2052148 RepID=A0A7V0XG51_UNCW3|nr:bifunctional folylpolyglutamate synthase/dihydrofolate synthase [candidate division WOR-3 bacterium]
MKYATAVGFLDSLVNYEKRVSPRDGFKLDAVRGLLELAGNPQRRLGRTVLVAGTKGKGSTCYMLEAALRGCGFRTGMFVSPHVRSVRERIQLDGQPVSKQVFADAVGRFAPLVRQQAVSYFELTAALAFDIFARRKLDCAIVEVGLGGRLDATNLCNPDVSVITRIGLDHTEVLGGTLGRIATEKAGVMRPGRPVVLGEQPRDAAEALSACARRVGALPVRAASDVRAWDPDLKPDGVEFSVLGRLGAGRVRLDLLGPHQVENCRTALAALGVLAASESRVLLGPAAAGLAGVRIPGRCEVVEREPLVVVDSCHNPDSGAALARAVAGHIGRPVVLLYGSLRGKRVLATVRPLQPWVKQAVLTRPASPRAARLAEVRRAFTRLGIRHEAEETVAAAIARARVISAGETPIVVAGSFYLADEALAVLAPDRWPAD